MRGGKPVDGPSDANRIVRSTPIAALDIETPPNRLRSISVKARAGENRSAPPARAPLRRNGAADGKSTVLVRLLTARFGSSALAAFPGRIRKTLPQSVTKNPYFARLHTA